MTGLSQAADLHRLAQGHGAANLANGVAHARVGRVQRLQFLGGLGFETFRRAVTAQANRLIPVRLWQFRLPEPEAVWLAPHWRPLAPETSAAKAKQA